MAFWNSKEKEDKKKQASKSRYKIVIKEKFAKGTTTLNTIFADRFIDPDDHVVYLKNQSVNFLELMPQDEPDYLKLDKAKIEIELKKNRDALDKERDKDNPDINDNNLEFNILKCEAKLRSLSFSKESEYITMDESGIKTFYYLREGSTFFPFKWDTDNKTVYVASENKKKKAGIARRNKALKYSKFKNVIEGSVMFMMIINVIAMVGLSIVAYQFFAKFDGSNIAEAQNYCVQKGAEWTAIIEKNAKASETIFENLKSQSERSSLVDKFIPKTTSAEGTG